MKRNIDVNLYAYGNAANNADSQQGPLVLKQQIEKTAVFDRCRWPTSLAVQSNLRQAAALPDVLMLSEQLAQSTRQSVLNHHLFVTLGGDHTAAIGSWSGAASAVQNLGLIWFDAHMDSHTFATTPSNNIHGMPLAILLGHGEHSLTHLMSSEPKLKPENVVLIGVRSYESGEAALLRQLGVKIYYMDDIKQLGISSVIEKSLAIVTRNTDAFGISIDLDGFDPQDAPGVGCREPDGVRADEFLAAFPRIAQHPKLVGADIVEFNPVLDTDHKTEQLAMRLFQLLAL